MQQIYVITHPEAEHHIQGIVGGQYDSHLTPKGKAAAKIIANSLKSDIGKSEIHIYSSALSRTMETADPIAMQFGVQAQPMEALREISYGLAEGKPQQWLDDRFVPAPDHNRLDHVSIEGGETKRSFALRVYDAVHQIAHDATNTKIIVTHGYAMTFVVAAWIRMPLEASGYINIKASPGGITLLQEDDFLRNRQLRYVNRISHLEQSIT
ncbi:MAG: histidine phosphatase family protein [Verrucomicrobiia bacterium]